MERDKSYRAFEKSMGMKTKDPVDEIKNAIEFLGLCYNKILHDKVIDAYTLMLRSKYDNGIIKKSCSTIMKNEKYFPSVQVLMVECMLQKQLKKSTEVVKIDCLRCSGVGRIPHIQEGSNIEQMYRCTCEKGNEYMSFKCISELDN